jgi:hypothetical protein
MEVGDECHSFAFITDPFVTVPLDGQSNGYLQMLSIKRVTTAMLLLFMFCAAGAGSDERELVQLPPMMQEHMLSNMRDHLVALNDILSKMAAGDLDAAAETAESRLGMSALDAHGASHMAKFMPEGMQSAGTRMHRAASRFALKAQEGEALPAYQALSEITAACVACHEAYRIR